MLMPLLDPNHSWLWWIVIGGIAGAIAKNKSRFDDPWGLVAMFLAASAKASVNATVVSSKLTLFLP